MNLKIFKEYIKKDINPKRKKNGLKKLNDAEIEKCYQILKEFFDGIEKKSQQTEDRLNKYNQEAEG